MKANYHTHTYRCNHASGSEEDYIKAAIKAGLEEIGMSDHCPWPIRKRYQMRMEMREFEPYVNELKRLKEKYKDQISIKLGLECEYFPNEWKTLRFFKEHPDLDYLIFGNHFHLQESSDWYYGTCVRDEEILRHYVTDAVAGMETGYFRIFAHPDLCFRSYPVFDEAAKQASYDICLKAKELGVILEYNLGGLRMYRHEIPHYPRYEFWQAAAEVGNAVIIGVDAHNPLDLLDQATYQQAEKTLQELGITNRIDKLEWSK